MKKENNIKVELLHNTPLWVASRAIRKCWASEGKSDTSFDECFENPITGDIHTHVKTGTKDKELIDRIGNKNKHTSVKNHVTYNFDIKGITTKTLLALTRHDVGTEFSVQSTRYTCSRELKHEEPFCTFT